MHVGIIADTHDNVDAVEAATETFDDEGVEVIVHCGDVVAPPTLPAFEGFELHGVLGNNDGEVLGLASAFDALGNGSELHGRFADLALDGLSMAVLHGESREEVEAVAASERYDVVCYGHHHERDRRVVGGTTILNPGAHFPTVPDEHRTVAILDTRTGVVTFRSVVDRE